MFSVAVVVYILGRRLLDLFIFADKRPRVNRNAGFLISALFGQYGLTRSDKIAVSGKQICLRQAAKSV